MDIKKKGCDIMKKHIDMSYLSSKPFEHFIYVSYPGIKERRYMIGDHGSVYSPKYDKFIKPRIDKDGYYRVKLRCSNGKSILIGVHRLVAWEFCDGYDEKSGKTIPNHLDSCPSNNYYKNLEWVTGSENCLYAYRMGRRHPRIGEDSNWAKYTEKQIHEACYLKSTGISNKVISERLGINRNYLSDIFCGKKWLHVSRKYKLPKPRAVNFKGFDVSTTEKVLKFLRIGLKPKEICKKLNIPYNNEHKNAITNLRKKL